MKKSILLLVILLGLFFSVKAIAQDNTKSVTLTKAYKLINKGEPIAIYKYEHKAHSAKEAEKYASRYYFQIPASNEVFPLTKMNLKKAFPSNHGFHDALDARFDQDSELSAYDSFHKMYKLNWIYKNHLDNARQ